MSKIGMREMLEAGAHFGHSTRRWNPKMAPYIFGPRNGIHIIDLQQTVGLFKNAYDFMRNTVARGGKVLFVGTKKQAQEVVKNAAADANQFYVNYRWLGGMLTNFKTIKQSVERLRKLSDMANDGTFDKLPKKEAIKLRRELEKLERNLSGIKDMTKPPRAIMIVDPKKEHIAVLEAHHLKIPVVALLDTNCDPDDVDFPIPANDDSIRSVGLFVEKLANACKEGDQSFQHELAERKQKALERGDAEKSKPSGHKPQKKAGPRVEVVSIRTENEAEEGEEKAAPVTYEESAEEDAEEKA
jgi:small subunit ribosomal protein S2